MTTKIDLFTNNTLLEIFICKRFNTYFLNYEEFFVESINNLTFNAIFPFVVKNKFYFTGNKRNVS
jgi:hypothetical protein